MSNANYTVDVASNNIFDVSVGYDQTATITGWVSATFSPASAISSVPLNEVLIINESTVWSEVSTNQGAFPVVLLNNGSGSSQVVYVSAVMSNYNNASDLIDSNLGYQFWFTAASLTSGAAEVLGEPGSAIYIKNDAFTGDLSAAGANITYSVTPTSNLVNVAVPYGTYSDYVYGTATFISSSLEGDNTALQSVDFDIYLSGADTSKFAAISANVALPGTIQIGETVTFNTRFNNTYLHAGTETFTVVAVVSTSNPALSAGWYGTYTPSTTDFITTQYTTTALGDAGAPSGVTAFTATAGQTRVALSWTNPADSDLSAVQVQYAVGTVCPATYLAGDTLYLGVGTSTEQTGLTGGTAMAYSIFTQDNVGNWSSLTATTSATATPIANNSYGTNAFPYLTNDQIRARLFDEGII
jgi:hypothetical protein